MKKLICLTALSVLLCTGASAQMQWELGASLNSTTYYGDLGNEKFYPLSSTRMGATFIIRNLLNNPMYSGRRNFPFSVETRISVHQIGYDETKALHGDTGFELRNYGRGLSFKNTIIGSSLIFTYNYYPDIYLPLYKQKFAGYVFGGVGVFYSNPKADLFRGDPDLGNRYYFWSDGTVRDAAEITGSGNEIEKDGTFETDLRDWRTEGQGDINEATGRKKIYSQFHVGFPLGIGLRYGINDKMTLSSEFAVYRFMTDYLDDASERYATTDEIQNNFPGNPVQQGMATYVSDPTGRGSDGTGQLPGTSPRGNPKTNDWYTVFSVEFSYRLEHRYHAYRKHR